MKQVELKFQMWQEVYFFLQNSLSIRKGQVSGYFLTVMDHEVDDPDGNDIKYFYQVTYYNELEGGGQRLMIAPLDAEDIFSDEESAKAAFLPWREKQINSFIDDNKKTLEGAETNLKFQQEILDGANKEITRLEEELKKDPEVL